MTRTFRYPLHPNRCQETVLLAWIEYCRQLYNAALEHRIGAWKRARVSVSYNAQTAELTALRAGDTEAAGVPVEVQRSALRRLDHAFAAFFRRCKAGERPGYPRFRGRQWYDSFSFGDSPRVVGNRVFIPKLGAVRFHLYRPLQGEVREVVIRRKCGRWWACFSCDLGDAPEKKPVASAVGVDLGLTTFAMLSDGSGVENPRYFRKGEELLAQRQRRLACRKRGSRSRERARLLVAKAYEHVQNQRLDFSRKLAADLFSRHDLIAYEDLAIRNMVRSPLGKSISDASWGVFIHALLCKAEKAGRHAVAVDPRNTTAMCSGCGRVQTKKLSERQHRCECGLHLSRDENAARNVLALAAGRAVAGLRPAEVQKPRTLPHSAAKSSGKVIAGLR